MKKSSLLFATNLQQTPLNEASKGHKRTESLQMLQRKLQTARENSLAIPSIMQVSVVMDKRRAKQDGTYPIKLRYRYRGSALYYTLPISIREGYFVDGVVVTTRNRRMLNNLIEGYRQRAQALLDMLTDSGDMQTFAKPSDLKSYVDSVLSGDVDPTAELEQHEAPTLVGVMERFIEERKAISGFKYVESMRSAQTKVEDYDHGVLLSEVTVRWLRAFESYCLSEGMSLNGLAVYLRNIRTVINYAIDMELMSIDQYPFRRFKIRTQPTQHRALTAEELKAVLTYQPTGERDARAKDIFILSLCLCGMNVRDLVLMKKSDIRGGRIETLRQKTDVPISLAIPPEALEIIERHKGSGEYLLNLMEVYAQVESVPGHLNKGLRCILPHLTTYYARHTWATIAAELDVPDPVIDMAQGRTPTGVTAIYVKRNPYKADEANRKVLDYVFGEIDD